MSVPPDQALATDPISPLGDGLSVGSDQYAIYDPRKNQRVQQQKQLEQQAQQSAVGNLKQKAGMEAAQQPDEFQGQQPPTTMVPEIMKSMAPMMLLTALGGKFTKQSGMTMLGAMNGMVQGINKGDEAGRDRAWQQYQDTYKQWKDKVDEAHRVYEQHKAALGDNAFADMQAQKFANQLIGDENEQMSNIAGQMNKKYELAQRHSEAMNKVSDGIKQNKLWSHEMDEAYTAQDEANQYDQAIGYLNRMNTLLPSIVKKYGTTLSTMKSSDDISKQLEFFKASGDQEVGAYLAAEAEVGRLLTTLKLPPGGRPNMFLEKKGAATAPQLFTMAPSEISQLITDATSTLNKYGAQVKSKAKAHASMAEQIRSGSMSAVFGDQQDQPQSPSSSKTFSSESDAESAAKRGLIKPGDKIIIGGVSGTWQ
jgi:tetratricopeptide (TPR) repeat protein